MRSYKFLQQYIQNVVYWCCAALRVLCAGVAACLCVHIYRGFHNMHVPGRRLLVCKIGKIRQKTSCFFGFVFVREVKSSLK